MTRIAFQSQKKADNGRIYSDYIHEVRVYKITDDSKFEKLVRCLSIERPEGRELLEDLIIKWGIAEQETIIETISMIWDNQNPPLPIRK